jgi:anti-sigma factor (TIGR02949 family)
MAEFDCQETKRHVHEFLHQELSEAEMTEITAHLAHCDSCELDYDLEASLNDLILRSCTEVPPQELADSILERIRDIQQAHKGHQG